MNYTPSQRFEALAYYLGWQGGTIHQIEVEIGCDNVLSREMETSYGYNDGFSAIRTCPTEWRINKLLPESRGNQLYWCGAIRGYWATGALGGEEFSKRFNN